MTDDDYLRYVDGRARYDGVAAFLESRGVTPPVGDPDDTPDRGHRVRPGEPEERSVRRRGP